MARPPIKRSPFLYSGPRRQTEVLAGVAGAVLVASIFLVSTVDSFLIGKQQYAAVVTAVLVDLANGDRAAQNVGTLTVNPALVAVAQAKANDMAAKGYFAHTSPEGYEPWHWFETVGYSFDYAGENLAIDFNDSVDVNTAWMNSPTHRQNLLDPHFTEIGIATAQGMYQGRLTTFVVQAFGKPATKKSAVVAQSLPQNPTEPALASATPATVLGESAPARPEVLAQAVPESTPSAESLEEPVEVLSSSEETAQAPAAVSTVAPDYAPWWAHVVASPRQSLQYAYWIIGLFIIVALMFTTGLEIRWHHRLKAIAAGTVLAIMCSLFVMGDTFIFGEPKLTAASMMTAAPSLLLR